MSSDDLEKGPAPPTKVLWYRSTYYNAIVLGLCNFCAPGLLYFATSAPYLVNTANALIFCLMIITAFASPALINKVGIRITLIIGTLGYAPYAAGLYTNNRYGTKWFVLFGAALCGVTAGTFWMAEGAIALNYPEPERRGKFLGLWLTFRIAGQVVGGAINVGINANANQAGSVSYTVYLVFIALQCLGPVCGLFLTSPSKLQRTDNVKVDMRSHRSTWTEFKLTAKLFAQPKARFLLIVPLIANYVYTESVMFTYLSLWFTVRARSLGSLVSGVAAGIAGNLMGRLLDNEKLSLKLRSRSAFFITVVVQGGLLSWNVANSYFFRKTLPTYDWDDAGFGNAFAMEVLQVANFQVCYLALFWFCGALASTPEEAVRIAGLLRAVESASAALSYGLSSISSFAYLYGAVLNLVMWGVAVIPGWFSIREIGIKYHGQE
ncbi:hypothetical protein FISHEDRAFT_51852 [Fistulina hepatica ATCC 64428]|nr:hypothetical protein FISHEDRAFT_51852 [Fistulina hepatica ATCC 64428]